MSIHVKSTLTINLYLHKFFSVIGHLNFIGGINRAFEVKMDDMPLKQRTILQF